MSGRRRRSRRRGSRTTLRDALRSPPQRAPVARPRVPRGRARAALALSDTFSDVDRSRDVDGAIAWQERINEWPQTRAYKARSYELCGDDAPMLEVGAGSGVDAAVLGSFACDRSHAMTRAARARGVVACGADAHALPFADNTFAAVRADRVIQHVAAPAGAIAEMLRVCRPGGRVVVCDPDQESLVIEVPGVRAELVDRVKRLRRDIGYRNGTFIRGLPALF